MLTGLKIQKLRLLKRISQEDLANMIGVSQSTIHEIESGKTKKIDFALIAKLCNRLDVDIRYFLENTKLDQIFNSSDIGFISDQLDYNNTEKLIENYERIIKLKDALILEKDLIIKMLKE